MRPQTTRLPALVAAALIAIAGAVAPIPGPAVSPASAAEAADPALAAEATGAINAWFAAIMSRDPATLGKVLAPEFQIMRADGSGYDAAGYPTSELPVIAEMPTIEDLVATREGDILVARYMVNLDSTRDGKTVEAYAPRLTVFRRSGDAWLVVAHGNFATLEQ